MGGKKPVDKSREWEKERREKLNVAFNDLFKLLPDHDPSISLSKVDILRKAAEYIRLLQEQNDEIIKSSDCHVLKNEAERLKKRVAYLLLKTKELVTALRDAGVPIPKPKKIRKRKKNNAVNGKDQNQIPSPSGASVLPTTAAAFVVPNTKVNLASRSTITVKKGKCGCVKDKKSPLSELNPTNAALPGTSLGTNVTVVGPTMLSASMQAVPGLIDKNILTPTLGPGTLIFRDGRVVSVPSPAPLVPQILVNTNTVRSAVFVMQTPQPVTVKRDKFTHIAPKQREVTQTTFTNSAPIPAIKTFRLEPYPVTAKSKVKKRKGVNLHSKMSGEPVEPAIGAGKVPPVSKIRRTLKRKREKGRSVVVESKVTKLTGSDQSDSTDALKCSTENELSEAGGGPVDTGSEVTESDQSNVDKNDDNRVESKVDESPEGDFNKVDVALRDPKDLSSETMETNDDDGGISPDSPAVSPDTVASVKETSPVLQPTSVDAVKDDSIINDANDIKSNNQNVTELSPGTTCVLPSSVISGSAVVVSQDTSVPDAERSQLMKPSDVESNLCSQNEVSVMICQGDENVKLTAEVSRASSDIEGSHTNVPKQPEENKLTPVKDRVEKKQPESDNSQTTASTTSSSGGLTSIPSVVDAGITLFLNRENQKSHKASAAACSSDVERPLNEQSNPQQHMSTLCQPGHLTHQHGSEPYHSDCQKILPVGGHYQVPATSNSGTTDPAEKVLNTESGNVGSSDSTSLRETSTGTELPCSSNKGSTSENGTSAVIPTYSNEDKAASRPSLTQCENSNDKRTKDVKTKTAQTADVEHSNVEMVHQCVPSTTSTPKVAPVTSQSMANNLNKQTLAKPSAVDSTPTTLITSNTQMYPIGISGTSDMSSRSENLFNYDTPLTDPFFSNFMGKHTDAPIPSQNGFNYNSFTTQAPPGRSVARQLFPSDPLCSIANSYNLLNNRQNDFDVNIPLNSSTASQMFQFSTYSSANSFRDPILFPNDFMSTPTKSSALESGILNDKDPANGQPQNFPEPLHSSSNMNSFSSIACNFSVSSVPVSGSMCISGDSPSNSTPFTIQHNKQCPAESLITTDSRSKQNSKSCGISGSFSMNVITSNAKTELKSHEPPYQKSNEAQRANFHYLPPALHSRSSQIAPEPNYNFPVLPPSGQPPNSSGSYNFHPQSNSASAADKNTRKISQSVTTQKPSLTNVNAPVNGNGSSGSIRESTNQYQSNSFHNSVCEQYASHPAKAHHPGSNVNMANFNSGSSSQQTSNNQGVQTQQSYLCNNSSLVQQGNQNLNQLPPGSQSFPTRNTTHHLVHSDKKYPKVVRMSQDAPYRVPSQQVTMKPTPGANNPGDCKMPNIHPQKSYQHSSAGPTQTTATISSQNPHYSMHNVFSHSNAIGQKVYQGQVSSYGNVPNASIPQSIYSNPTSIGSQAYTASTVVTSSHSHNGHNHNLFSHMNVNANVHTNQMLNNSNYGSSAQLFPNVDTISQQNQDNRNRKSHANLANVQVPTNKPPSTPMTPQGSGQFGMQNMKVSHVSTAPNFSMSSVTNYPRQSTIQSRNDNSQPVSKRMPNQTSLNLNYSQTPVKQNNMNKNDVTSQYPPASMNSVPLPPKQCDYPLASILTGLNDPMLNNQLISTEVTPNQQHKIPDSSSSEKNAGCGDKVIDKQYSTNTEGNTFKADSVCTVDFLRTKDNERNSFIPIMEDVRLNSDFSNDLFSSLQVPTGGAHSDSISPTAAFLLAFPLVSTSKNTDNLHEADQPDNNTSTPTTILQIGNIDPPNSEMFHPLEFGKDIEASDYLGQVQDKCKRKDMSGKQKKQGMGTYPNNYSYPSMPGDFNIHYDQSWSDNQDKNKQVERKKNDKSAAKFNNGGNIEFCKQDKKKKNKISVNWMAVPEANETYSKEAESSSFPAATLQFPMDMDGLPDLCSSKKNSGNVYSWSPTKTLLPLDSSLMIPSTLPTLVGDLALGTTTPSDPYNKRCDAGQPGQLKKPAEKPPEKREVQKSQNNFLSVSQLVDPKSKKQKLPEAKCKKTDKKKAPCQKRKEPNDPCMYPDNLLPPIGWDKYRYRNNYSAEALIGTQDVNESLNFSYQQNPAQAYFVGPELNQEHSQQYQNSFNFTQNQFSSFVAEEFQSNNFSVSQPQSGSAAKRSTSDKREGRCRDETSNRFLGNSTAYQQPPHQPYASTALPSSSASHPSHFTSNTTTSVTNFNLSTIFPEINERTGSQGQAQPGQQHNSAQHPHAGMNSFSNNSSNNNYRNHNI